MNTTHSGSGQTVGRKASKGLVSISEQRKAISQKKLSHAYGPQRRKRVKPVSDKRRAELKEYGQLKEQFLKSEIWCAVYPTLQAEDIHHMRGHAGKLFLNPRYWRAVSRLGHRWIHDNPNEARKRGLLCALGDWGKQE